MLKTLEMIGQMRRRLVLGLLVALAPLALGGCFGGFPMTKAVYHGNRNVYSSVEGDRTQRKLAQSGVMWLFIPVYAGAAVGDMVVFNLIEFWTGTQTDLAYNHEASGTKVVLVPSKGGQEVALTVSQQGQIVTQAKIVQISDQEFEVRNAEGLLDGKITRRQDGSLCLTDPKGTVIQDLSAQELAALGKI